MNGSRIKGGLLPAKVFFSGSEADQERNITLNGEPISQFFDTQEVKDNFFYFELHESVTCDQDYRNVEDKLKRCCYI